MVSILKKNPEVWQAYQSGNFKVKEVFEDGNRRIILKEKGKKGEDYEYTVKKYKVGLHHSKHHIVKEDEKNLLLVSFSSSSINNQPLVAKTGASSAVAAIPEQQLVQYQSNQEPQQVSVYRPISQAHIVPPTPHSNSVQSNYISQPPLYTHAPAVYQDTNTTALRTITTNSFYPQTAIIAQPANYGAPGDDFIQKLINGDDDDIEYLIPEVHELVGNFLIYPKQKAQTPKKLERDNSFFDDSYDQDYIKKYAPSKKNQNESRSSVGSRSLSESRSTIASRNESRNSNAATDGYLSSKPRGNQESPIPVTSREENNNSRLSALNYSPAVPESDDVRVFYWIKKNIISLNSLFLRTVQK